MRDILGDLDRWQAEERRFALATVVQTWGSAPRRAGSTMGVTADGQFSGSVSGGCVENAVIEAALESLRSDRAQLLHFGVADESAWEVGLACGGTIEIFVRPLAPDVFPALRAAWAAEALAVHAMVIRGPEHILGREMLIRDDGFVVGSIDDRRNPEVLKLASQVLWQGKSQRLMLDDEIELFLDFISPSPILIAVGGVHITVALMSLAKMLGFRTILIDPRKLWGREERFPHVDQLVQAWPEDAFEQIPISHSTAIVMLTHDPKLDDPALKIALTSPAFYVGALGSKTTNAKRHERLLKDGLMEEQWSRLHAPIGLDIGAVTPEEIALAIMSEVIEAYRKQTPVEVLKEPNAVSST